MDGAPLSPRRPVRGMGWEVRSGGLAGPRRCRARAAARAGACLRGRVRRRLADRRLAAPPGAAGLGLAAPALASGRRLAGVLETGQALRSRPEAAVQQLEGAEGGLADQVTPPRASLDRVQTADHQLLSDTSVDQLGGCLGGLSRGLAHLAAYLPVDRGAPALQPADLLGGRTDGVAGRVDHL